MYVIKDNLAVNLEITQTIEVKSFAGIDQSTNRIADIWVIAFDSTIKFGFDSEEEATSVMADIMSAYDSGQTRVLNLDYLKKGGSGQ